MFNIKFSNAVSPVMGEFVLFHDLLLYVLLLIVILVGGVMYLVMFKKYFSLSFLDYSFLEIVWTVLPGVVLFVLALPSLKLLYYMDLSMNMNPDGTVKSIGYQWYWKYSYKGFSGFDFSKLVFDSYMVTLSGDLGLGDLRLLEVDLPVMVPLGSFIRFIIGSGDVMHSFTVNGLGIKVDAVPGRLNTGFLYSSIYGNFYGQCSEICGANHSFMPMAVEVVPRNV